MDSSNFVDYVKITCRSGKGGSGSTHLARFKYIPRGGPDGGDGGHGGDVIVVGNRNLWTLLHLKYRKHVYAEDGGGGMSTNKSGSDGKNAYIEVPLGTVIRDEENENIKYEVSEDGQEVIILKGGRGGKGNAFFKTATHQTPKYSQPGEFGFEKILIFELKLLADVGLVGFPNAGKSTLLSVVTAAKPQIANYPFTTIVPNLGIVPYKNERSFVMADLPGIIEDAHLGKGLGIRFLRHIERNSVLLFMIPADAENIAEEYNVLLKELELYNFELMLKPRLIAITKCDLIHPNTYRAIRKKMPDVPYVFISSITNKGLDELKDTLFRLIDSN